MEHIGRINSGLEFDTIFLLNEMIMVMVRYGNIFFKDGALNLTLSMK